MGKIIKLRDLVNPKLNKANNQNSLDVRSLKLKKFDLDIEDILDTTIKKKIIW